MRRSRILATGSHQPGTPISNAQIERLAGPLPPEVLEGISIKQRFWMIDPETGEHRDSNSGMATTAVRRALDAAGLAPGDVDLLVLATGTPDYPLPAVVNLVQENLGIEECATLEIRSGGAGVVQGLDIARLLLERGDHDVAVVVGSEAISPVLAPVYLGRSPDAVRMRDRMPLYMFGDGAGAIVLGFAEGDEADGGLGAAVSRCIGGTRKPGIWSVGGGTHAPIHEQLAARRLVDLRVDVVGAGDFTPHMVTRAISETLAGAGIAASSIDVCLVPEGNVGWMLDALHDAGLTTPDWVALQGRIVDNLDQTGAVGCAAVPLFLDHEWRTGGVRPGHRALLVGVESTKWIYAGIVVDWTAARPERTPAPAIGAAA
jgi:3-oxoacyl-[acyl-carrier-protein] synthase III